MKINPIVFARVADMKYYKGITEKDTPANGGAFVRDTGLAHECNNFRPVIEEGEDFEKCIGYCQMSGGKNGVSQLHIEKIIGCEACKEEVTVENVIVVFVSKAHGAKSMRVVGFYKNATVYRYPRCMVLDNDYEQTYWFEAKKEDCVLLPYTERFSSSRWFVPNSSAKDDFGFGRSHIWYSGSKGASEKELEYVKKMINSVETYQGENWMNKEV